MTIWTAQDRSIAVSPGHTVSTRWIDIDDARLGNRARIAVGDIDAAYRKLLCIGDRAPWPCIVGEWTTTTNPPHTNAPTTDAPARFTILDGRHEYIASLMMGRTKLFVAWLEKDTTEENTIADAA
jgi:hypothetical protein